MTARDFPRFIGMVHLPPLPGSPRAKSSLVSLETQILRDATALADGGANALIIENFGDAPFHAGRVEAHTVAAMTRLALCIRDTVDLPIGINVLRNDALAALAIAAAVEAAFIRVNILTGTMAADQGLITGEADRLMRLRRQLDATDIKVFADVLVKHATPLAHLSIEDAVADTVQRGLADAVIVSGSATGKPTDLDSLRRAVAAAGNAPVYVGSGATAETIGELVPPATGAIVGSSLKEDGKVDHPVNRERVRAFARALKRTDG